MHEAESVDLLVVGAGPTGAAWARTVLEEWPDARVLLIDAGPAVTDPPGLHMANIEDAPTRTAAQVRFQGPFPHEYERLSHEEVVTASEERLDRTLIERPGLYSIGGAGGEFPAAQSSSGVGGMGSHWFGACPRPDEWERIHLIERATLDAAYERAERMLRVGNDQYSDKWTAERIRAALGGVVDEGRAPHRRVQQMPMALRLTPRGVRRSGPDVILGDLLTGAADGFELRPDTLARRVMITDGRADGVELEDRTSGERYIVSARHVVVAADSVHTPQLLWASGVRPWALGRHLNEHPQVSLMAVLEDGKNEEAAARAAELAAGEEGSTGVMSDPSAMAIASSGVTWMPVAGEDFPFHSQVSNVEPRTLGLTDEQIAELGPILALSFFLRQELDPENRVEFSDTETDWQGLPKPIFHFRMSDGDRAMIERAQQKAREIAHAIGRPLYDEPARSLLPGSSLHYEGTVRMGAADDGQSVCDTRSRVWGTENLYVAGNGIIPVSTACNPTLTSVAVAVLGAQALVEGARESVGASGEGTRSAAAAD